MCRKQSSDKVTVYSDNEQIVDESSSDDSLSNNELVPEESVVDDATCVFRYEYGLEVRVDSGSLSKNGELAVTIDLNDRIYVWNTDTGDSIFYIDMPFATRVVGFNYNDEYVAAGTEYGKIQLWKISDKTCVWETTLENDIISMKWHHSANILIVTVKTWDVYMLKPQKNDIKVLVQYTGDQIWTGTIFPDGERMAIGYESGKIEVIDLETSAVLSTTPADPTRLCGHASGVVGLDCHMDNNLIISVSLENQIILSTAHDGKVVCVLQDVGMSSGDQVGTVALCKDPTFPVAASLMFVNGHEGVTGKIYIWDISKQTLMHEINQDEVILDLVWTKTSIFFTIGISIKVKCFDARTGCCLRTFSGHRADTLDAHLCVSSDGKKALTIATDNTARIFDISSVC
ncbi:PREDICTED: angio-associated migratory cell protein-like [Vollenhovia emeryi]|uniref:angio-associated migratory cell protein-like n=1 Tax=Vollenhovia emeryi TaxID=411798 RepID=UPI0005F3CD18|nr:PREDICTED: angio-associated migratory cell protein-like [Vollenhovia emeryi]XP_011869792.1 PREDICTED: angio-associated migratory cell protein-like [Vollenhovia emeryi]